MSHLGHSSVPSELRFALPERLPDETSTATEDTMHTKPLRLDEFTSRHVWCWRRRPVSDEWDDYGAGEQDGCPFFWA